jgi:hypothetical protein
MKKILMKFNLKTGQAKIEAEGFKGTSCSEATQFLKDTLGEVTDFSQKAEWYETNLELSGSIDSDLCG